MSTTEDWRNSEFKKKILDIIKKVAEKSNKFTLFNIYAMENVYFLTADNKDDYLTFIARLISHIQEE
ncbi:hypothetical protein M0804_004673 [Polistes exclamans]|nr:hypothetical protein M0804_004673 [Polistes exclamans]